MDDTSKLRSLGSGSTEYRYNEPSIDILETFPNRTPDRDYTVELTFSEFTSLCPKTGQPDFATIIIRYVPDLHCVESKSLKLYFFSFRNYGSFMESIVNKIRDDLIFICQPRFLEVVGAFAPRGGIEIQVKSIYGEKPVILG